MHAGDRAAFVLRPALGRRLCGAGPARRQSPGELLCELRDRFAPGRAQGVHAVVGFDVDAEAGVERFQLVIREGRCSLADHPLPARATIVIGLEDLAALVEGRLDATSLFMSQRLRIRGDVLLAARLPYLFPG